MNCAIQYRHKGKLLNFYTQADSIVVWKWKEPEKGPQPWEVAAVKKA